VTRLLGDDALGDTGRGSRSRKTGPQRVTGYFARVESDSGSEALQHERHRLAAESRWPDVVAAVDGAEGGSLGDA
jgi:hypothetical protein